MIYLNISWVSGNIVHSGWDKTDWETLNLLAEGQEIVHAQLQCLSSTQWFCTDF